MNVLHGVVVACRNNQQIEFDRLESDLAFYNRLLPVRATCREDYQTRTELQARVAKILARMEALTA